MEGEEEEEEEEEEQGVRGEGEEEVEVVEGADEGERKGVVLFEENVNMGQLGFFFFQHYDSP